MYILKSLLHMYINLLQTKMKHRNLFKEIKNPIYYSEQIVPTVSCYHILYLLPTYVIIGS